MKAQLARPAPSFYEFGPFRLDPVRRLLTREGEPLPLAQKPFDTLLVLVQNNNRVVDKDELLGRVWPDTIVEENNLTQSISMLRKMLGESRRDHKFIVTIQGRGYQFVADVKEVCEENTDLILLEHTRASIVIEEEAESGVERAPQITSTNLGTFPKNSFKNALIGLITLATIGGGLLLWKFKSSSQSDSAGVRSVAVVPFKSLNQDDEDKYLSSGIADAVAAKLSHIQQIIVPSAATASSLQNSNQDALSIGRQLRVDSVLEGSIKKEANRIHVTARLIRVSDGTILWSQSFDEELTEIFAVQDSISEQVAQVLRLKLTGGERDLLAKHYTENPEAYQSYIKGRYFWNKRTEAGLTKAIEYFRQAIEVDQHYALAYAGVADSYLMMAAYKYGTLPPDEAAHIARAATTKALELDEKLAEAHTSLAGFLETTGGDIPGAEREYKRAIELNPNYATARQWYGELLRGRGRFDEALVELKRAQALDPLSPIMNSSLGISYYYAREYDLVIEQNRKALELDPDFTPAHFGMGLALEQKGMYSDAIAEFQVARQLSKGSEHSIAALGHAYAKSGDRVRALQLFRELQNKPKPSSYNLALFYVVFGEKDKALPLLQKAREITGDQMMLRFDPRLDSLRSDAAFADVFKS
jgi:DNA-binding winged helix-turn-helix (wHTH) protein/TolB-like protein/Flp pilus assembly protein TadD